MPKKLKILALLLITLVSGVTILVVEFEDVFFNPNSYIRKNPMPPSIPMKWSGCEQPKLLKVREFIFSRNQYSAQTLYTDSDPVDVVSIELVLGNYVLISSNWDIMEGVPPPGIGGNCDVGRKDACTISRIDESQILTLDWPRAYAKTISKLHSATRIKVNYYNCSAGE